jgi:hypothetical protein
MLKKTNALAYTGTELFEDCNYVFNVGSLLSIHKRSTCADSSCRSLAIEDAVSPKPGVRHHSGLRSLRLAAESMLCTGLRPVSRCGSSV